ncbi:MAG: hypothetical protein M3Q49_20170 [Actinomycetota bacterium]|nr:hypothetical protein [Actinomycetota bacterium]
MSRDEPHNWADRITVVRRPLPEGGYEAVVTEGAPYHARISRTHPDAGEAFYFLCAILSRFRFDGEILLESHTKRGKVRREVLR